MNGASSPSHSPQSVITDDSGRIQQVGDWVLGVTLGKGSFGKVKLACHHRTREKVAVKIVDKSSISNVDDVERVYRETFILTTLKHAHIIKLYEVMDTADSIMLVMEYAGGGELFSYVSAQRRLPEPESCRLFSQIIAGVEYCHRAKIIHRDLKLENILLTEHSASSPPSVKIADFGLSNSIRLNEKMGTNCGTPSYTCPEQILGQAYIGSAADIWSLGVIFFAMTCGFLPFEAASIPLLFKKIRAGQYRCPSYLSAEAKDLIGRMLTVEPDRRATIAELRSHPWMLMDYTELIDRIEQMQPVTAEMIEEAHLACQSWTGEEDRKEKEESRRLTAVITAAPPTADSEQAAEADERPDVPSNASIAPLITRPASTTPNTEAISSAAADGAATSSKPAGKTRGLGGFRDREGSGAKASASMAAYAKAGHGAFDKLSIRTGGPTPGGKGPASGSSRRGAEQPTSASSASPSAVSPLTATAAASAAPNSGSSSSSTSQRHRKSISLAALNSSPSFSPSDPPARHSLLTVRDTESLKASTQPLRFPPISPTSGMSPAPHSAGILSVPEELSSPVSASKSKSRLKAMSAAVVAAAAAAGIMEEKERDREAPGRQQSATASLPNTTRRQKKDVISPIAHPPPPASSASASAQESKEREREREEGSSKAATRRPSMDALSGGGGGYMADTTASRHRLLGKLNVDLSS